MGEPYRTAITALDNDTLRDAEVVARQNPSFEVGASLRRLRERANLTQKELAARFHRKSTAVCNWEAGHTLPPRSLTAGILDTLGIPRPVIAQFIAIEDPESGLDPGLYALGDAATIEYQWWQRKRGKALQALYGRAIDGSAVDMKLLLDWMDKSEKQYFAGLSKPKETVVTYHQRKWANGSLTGKFAGDDAIAEAEAISLDTDDNSPPLSPENSA